MNSWVTKNTCTALLRQNRSGRLMLVTNVYGPSVDSLKPAFIREIQSLSALINQPWFLVGDFNVVRWMIERNNNSYNFALMEAFNDLILQLQVIEIHLQN